MDVSVPLDKYHKNVISSIELVKKADPEEKSIEENQFVKDKTNEMNLINQPSSGRVSQENMKTMFKKGSTNGEVSAKSSG
jgi:hypothetical protein